MYKALLFLFVFTVVAANNRCQAVIVYADRTNAAIRTWDPNTDRISTLVDLSSVFGPGNYGVYGIAADSTSIYWTDNGQRAIYRASRDGSGAVQIINTATLGSAIPADIHVNGSSLYWVDANVGAGEALFTADLDGSNSRELINMTSEFGDGTYANEGITSNGTNLFWTDNGQDAIYSSALDGTGAQKLFDLAAVRSVAGVSEGIHPLGITVGIAAGFGPHESLFWTDSLSDAVYQIRLDGGDLGNGLGQALAIWDQDNLGGGPYTPRGIAIIDSTLFFSDSSTRSLVGLAGVNSPSPNGVRLPSGLPYHIAAIPEPSAFAFLGTGIVLLFAQQCFHRNFWLLGN